MTIADRIQSLRKVKGISQEELADKIGITRQSVSKWESEQSVPDIDKIILMSEYFDVTTDYILKGIESSTQDHEKAVDANIFVVVATVLDFIGLIVSCAVWYEEQVPMALVIGLVFMALGSMVFALGLLGSSQSTREKAKQNFWIINIWLLSFIPLSFVYNQLLSGLSAPYPLLAEPYVVFLIFWLIYIVLCLGVVLLQMKRRRQQ